MAPLVLFPDPAAVLIGHVAAQLTAHGQAAPVHNAIPNPRPNRFVVVRSAGGGRESVVVDRPMVTVQGWDKRGDLAERLCQWVRAIIHAARGDVVAGVPVYRVDDVGGPVPVPDPLSAHQVYQCTLQVAMRGETP